MVYFKGGRLDIYMKKRMKRLGVFVFYDRDSIVDDYVLYLLDDMMRHLDDLVILSNSSLSRKEKNKFFKYTKTIIERENKGLDAGAWCEYFRGTKDYCNYDEVVCFNDTFFGPLYPFQEMFDAMAAKDVDFWGLSQGHTHRDGYGIFKDGAIPNHIQTFLITFRKKVLVSKVFQEYWDNYDLEHMLTFTDVVSKHELTFTKYLETHGFTWDCYVKDLDGTEDFKRNYVNFVHNAYGQIALCRAPFIKRKTVASNLDDVLYLTDLGDIRRAMRYIKEHTHYPISLIYKNVLRLYPLDLLRQGTGFYEIVHEKKHQENTKVFIFAKMDNALFIPHIKNIANFLDENKELVLYTKSKAIYEALKTDLTIHLYQDSWQTVAIQVLKNVKAPYIQFIHLKDDQDLITLISTASSLKVIENLFLSHDYYESVLDSIKDDQVSVVYTPENMHFDYFYKNIFLMDGQLEQLKKLFPSCKCFDEGVPFVIKSDSWLTKKEIVSSIDLSKIEPMEDEEFSTFLSLALSYAGISFYSIPKIVINEEMAETRLNTLSTIYKDTYQAIYQNNSYPLTYLECINRIRTQREERRFITVLKDTIKRKLHIRRFRFWKK